MIGGSNGRLLWLLAGCACVVSGCGNQVSHPQPSVGAKKIYEKHARPEAVKESPSRPQQDIDALVNQRVQEALDARDRKAADDALIRSLKQDVESYNRTLATLADLPWHLNADREAESIKRTKERYFPDRAAKVRRAIGIKDPIDASVRTEATFRQNLMEIQVLKDRIAKNRFANTMSRWAKRVTFNGLSQDQVASNPMCQPIRDWRFIEWVGDNEPSASN